LDWGRRFVVGGSSIQLGLQAGAFGFNFLAGMISTVVSYRLGLVDG
jgi:hypothetical protein